MSILILLSVILSNEPEPQKYIKIRLSPLYARTLELFDTLYDKYNQFAMENMHNYAYFYRSYYNK